MRVFFERTIANEALNEIRCNQCGEEISKNVLGYFDDHLSITKTWGYGTDMDGETHTFDLCCNCYCDMVEKFQIPLRD